VTKSIAGHSSAHKPSRALAASNLAESMGHQDAGLAEQVSGKPATFKAGT
jgi:hypothetical protein